MSGNGVGFDPLLDKRYHQTRLGRDVVDFLAWMELGGAASRTLDQYERDLSRGCLMFPGHSIEQWTDAELLHVARSFRPVSAECASQPGARSSSGRGRHGGSARTQWRRCRRSSGRRSA